MTPQADTAVGSADVAVPGPEEVGSTERSVRSTETMVRIEASPEAVWNGLTDPAELVRWFPLEAEVEPGPGGRVTYRWGDAWVWPTRIAIWEPAHRLRLSYVQDGSSEAKRAVTPMPDGAGDELVIDFEIEASAGATWLRVVHSGFGRDASWDDEFEGVRRGWIAEIASLKHYLEHHAGEDRRVWWTFAKTALEPGDVFARMVGGRGAERPFVEQRGDELYLYPGADDGVRFDAMRMEGPGELYGRVPDWNDALIRVWVDSLPGGCMVSVFLSLYGDATSRAAVLGESLHATVHRLFPEQQEGWTVLER